MRILRTAFLGLSIQILAAQQTPSGAFIEGVVVKLGTNDRLTAAVVELHPGQGGPAAASTAVDSDGRFFFTGVNAGSYRLVAKRRGYVSTEYGQRQPTGPGLIFTLSANQQAEPFRIEMTRGAVISGVVLDRGRHAGAQVRVAAVRASSELGQRVWREEHVATTDDLGEFRIFWLAPGKYYIIAEIPDGPSLPRRAPSDPEPGQNRSKLRAVFTRASSGGVSDTEVHVPIFAPGTPDWRLADTIEVGPGDEVRNVRIDGSPRPALHVRGVVTGIPVAAVPAGNRGAGASTAVTTVSLIPLDAIFAVSIPGLRTDQNGTFDFARVPPGSYLVTASAGNLSGKTAIVVRDRDVGGISIALTPGLTMSGRVTLEGQASVRPPVGIGLIADPLPPALITMPNYPILAQPGIQPAIQASTMITAGVTPDALGAFTIPQNLSNAALPRVSPGDYRVVVSPILMPPISPGVPAAFIPPGLRSSPAALPAPLENAYVKSIRMGNQDVLNDGLRLGNQPLQPLEIVIGTNPGAIEGRVLDTRQQLAPAVTVVLIPESGLRFHINHKFTSTDASGRFEIPNVPPGDYKLFAWEMAEPGAWQDPDFVREHESRGKPVRVEEGGKVTVELTSIP